MAKTKYKGVYLINHISRNGKHQIIYKACLLGKHIYRHTEREAALIIDRWLISAGKPPVNILKPLLIT